MTKKPEIIKTDLQTTFGAYLRGLRKAREMTLREVSEQATQISPNDKRGWMSYAYLVHVEKGTVLPPSTDKLKSLAKIYGEKYEFMLYKAGHLPTNPFASTKESTHEMKRDDYFNSLTNRNKRRSLTGDEKKTAERMLETFIKTLTRVTNEENK